MAGMGELNSVQAPLITALVKAGWTHVPGSELDRAHEQPFVESELVDALTRLNAPVAGDPERVEEILPQLRSLTLGARDDGLVQTNRAITEWLRGLHHHKFVGTQHHVPVRLIDFDDVRGNNSLIVSDEVYFGPPGKKARFDIVLWVNGIPLVVGELKSAVDRKVSWVKAAKDIAEHYEVYYPEFFTPGVISFATEGKELAYAATGTPVEHWRGWGPAQDVPKLEQVLRAARELLAPETVLDLLSDFTAFEAAEDENSAPLKKLVARYVQYEAVTLMHARAREGSSRRGLIYHTQGSGKTLAMVFAAGKLLREPALANPTIILIADRVQLVSQLWDQFRTTGMPRLITPSTATELRQLIGEQDQRGLIFSTVHKFAGAPLLSERENIVVLVDEAHRTQEGSLGSAMREALPNALFFGFSGTPLAELDRNTFDTFGDPEDEGRTLHTYDSDQSIADGMTLPIHVAPRMVNFHLQTDLLDEAFKELTAAEGLEEDEVEVLRRRASRVGTFFANRERVRKVCEDIVEHFYSTVDPLGMKAQLVVFDRAACVAYHEELTALLEQRHYADHPLDEAAVVMTVGGKDDDPSWSKYALTDSDEAALLKRFRTHGDRLKFLIVTSKLGTGFNAPIEGVMYLDKPLKKHTLFQTITRTNRTWRNPETGQEKHYGLVVDYVGLGQGFARAMAPANADQRKREIDLEGLVDAFEAQLKVAMYRFAGIDHTKVGPQTLMDAQQRLPDREAADDFALQYKALEGIWEAAYPHSRLEPHRTTYRFLSQVYASVTPSGGKDERLWQRLGAKTIQLVHEHMDDIVVSGDKAQVVIADANTIKKLVDEGLIPDLKDVDGKTAQDIVDSIATRLKKALEGTNGDHPVYRTLAERLDGLREQTLAAAEQSIEWLRELFTVARDLTIAEKAEAERGREGLDLLPDPRIGALTQIFAEYAPENTPVMIERVVDEIDDIVKDVTADNTGWAKTTRGDRLVRKGLREVLGKHQLHEVDGLFERAYEYIAEHY